LKRFACWWTLPFQVSALGSSRPETVRRVAQEIVKLEKTTKEELLNQGFKIGPISYGQEVPFSPFWFLQREQR